MKIFKKGELKLLWPFYSATFSFVFMFYSLFSVLYFKEIGLSFVQMGLLFTVMSIAAIIFEIPTGAVADIYGRKFSTILGYILMTLIPLLVFFTTEYYLILLAFILLGISSTFISGADQAWIVDLLKISKKKELIEHYYTKDRSINSLAGFISGFLGALFVSLFGLKIIWLSFSATYLFGTIFLIFGKEKFKKRKQHIREHFKEFITHNKESLRYSKNNKNTSKILLSTLFWGVVVYVLMAEIIWVPLIQSLGLKDAFFGFLTSGVWAIGIFAPFLGMFIYKKMKSRKNFLILVLTLILLSTSLVLFFNSLWAIILIYIFTLSLFEFWSPINMSLFHSFLPNKIRATVLSFRSFIFSLIGAFIPLVVGALLETTNPRWILFGGALFCIPVIIIYSKLKEK